MFPSWIGIGCMNLVRCFAIGQPQHLPVNISLTPLEQTAYIGESATFSCEAEITGREKIGFRILRTDEIMELILQNEESCMHNTDTLECEVSYDEFVVLTSCQYEDPYSIKCNFQIHLISSKAAEPLKVECFIMDEFTRITTSISANLTIRCKFTVIIITPV